MCGKHNQDSQGPCGCQWPEVVSNGRSWSPPGTTSQRTHPDCETHKTTPSITHTILLYFGHWHIYMLHQTHKNENLQTLIINGSNRISTQLTSICPVPSLASEWWHNPVDVAHTRAKWFRHFCVYQQGSKVSRRLSAYLDSMFLLYTQTDFAFMRTSKPWSKRADSYFRHNAELHFVVEMPMRANSHIIRIMVYLHTSPLFVPPTMK